MGMKEGGLENKIVAEEEYQKIEGLAEAIKKTKEDLKDKEIVFVFGAGASGESGVPLGRELRQALMRGYQDLMATMLETKIGIKNINDATLEMIVSLYNELCQDEKAGYEYLKTKCPDVLEAYTRNIPFVYEVVAHMFYFRLVRYVISLNFDELLERALDDEVGEGGYEKIRSSAAFERVAMIFDEDEEQGRPPRRRFLLKPHGTIGNRMTMRHSWEEVTRLDKETHQVIARIMEKTAILVTVGYSFMDRDLRGLFLSPFLADNVPEYRKLYVIDTENSDIEGRHPFKELQDNKNIVFIKTGAEKFSELFAQKLFSGAWNDFYCGIQKHRARYLIKRKLFSARSGVNLSRKIRVKRAQCIYCHLLIEILLFILSVKGKFRGDVLLESRRVSRYLRALQGYYGFEVRPRIPPKDYSIRKALEVYAPAFLRRKMPENELGREIYYCEGPDENSDNPEIFIIHGLLKCLTERLKGRGFNFQVQEIDFVNDQELAQSLQEVINLFDISLVEKTNLLMAFNNPFILCNYKQFFQKTAEIIQKWHGLLISAETGEWIKRAVEKHIELSKKDDPAYSFAAKDVGVIINDFSEEPQNSYHRSRVEEIVEFLQAHNIFVRINRKTIIPHHFTISTIPPQRAIYFYRYGRSISVCPIYLKDTEDVDTLLRWWTELWRNAEEP